MWPPTSSTQVVMSPSTSRASRSPSRKSPARSVSASTISGSIGSSRYVRRGGLVALGDSEPAGGGDPLVVSTSEARSPLPPGAVVEDGCAVGDAATVAASGVPIDGVGSSLATVPTPGSTTEFAPTDPAPEPTPKPAEASPPEPVPDPVPTPATLGAE